MSLRLGERRSWRLWSDGVHGRSHEKLHGVWADFLELLRDDAGWSL